MRNFGEQRCARFPAALMRPPFWKVEPFQLFVVDVAVLAVVRLDNAAIDVMSIPRSCLGRQIGALPAMRPI